MMSSLELTSVLVQLGDTLATIATREGLCQNKTEG